MTATKRKAKAATEAAPPVVIAYKGFDKNWQCRGFQYEVGKTYEHAGKVTRCGEGFHSCEFPLDVLRYYSPADGAKFASVEASGDLAREPNSDTKLAASRLAVKAELSLGALITASVEWIKTNTKDAANIASGYSSTAASSGYYSKAASAGHSSTAASAGHYSTAASAGDSSKAASAGHSSKAASAGNYSTAASAGNYSTAASAGNYSTAASAGDSSTAASAGHSSTAASAGNYSTAASSGDYSKAASSGNYSKAASSGDYSKANCGTNGFACVAGVGGVVGGGEGSALACGYRDAAGVNRFAIGTVGLDGIKPDTGYRADPATGKLVEVR